MTASGWTSFDDTKLEAAARQAVEGMSPFARTKAESSGEGAWLEALPALVTGLVREWGLDLGQPLQGGTEAFVCAVRLPDRTPAVLRVLSPHEPEAVRNELTVLRLAEGQGCPLLYQSDEHRGALLLERLGRPMAELGLPLGRRHDLLCEAVSRIWRPAPEAGLPTGADKGRWLIDFIERTWEELNRPCSEQAVAEALTCAQRRIAAHDDERAVVVHGDVHEWNALEAEDGFKLVDPDGLLAEPEYDLGVLMREDTTALLQGDPQERARALAARTGLDARAIWEWGVVERMSTGLGATAIGLQPEGRDMLEAAERLVRS